MQTTKEMILKALFHAIDVINRQLADDRQLQKTEDTVLYGSSGALDSLGLVNVIVVVEQQIEKEFGVIITLADEKALSQKNSPFRTIGTLAEYISSVLSENGQEQ